MIDYILYQDDPSAETAFEQAVACFRKQKLSACRHFLDAYVELKGGPDEVDLCMSHNEADEAYRKAACAAMRTDDGDGLWEEWPSGPIPRRFAALIGKIEGQLSMAAMREYRRRVKAEKRV